ncbi:MAG: hypothetical protein WCD18_27325 [Thermosynechococcaceae cyanobacterium]
MTPEETLSNAWECAAVALYNLTYESADLNVMTDDEIEALTRQLKDISRWFNSQQGRYQQDCELRNRRDD